MEAFGCFFPVSPLILLRASTGVTSASLVFRVPAEDEARMWYPEGRSPTLVVIVMDVGEQTLFDLELLPRDR
ncbi:hypothetical protein F5Y17DRAFT_435944 [Xylariaceae sp. FL0594]|nr:hypothetical protein F5Y17DRAFT_435944 [Xylariaceae sp. FL0594]